MKVRALGSKDPWDNQRNLLHAAAARRSSFIEFPEVDENLKRWFLQSWNGQEEITAYARNYDRNKSSSGGLLGMNRWPHETLEACGNPQHSEFRTAVVRWLIEKGVDLPDCNFLINECDYATAAVILQYRLDVDSIIFSRLSDRAPLAVALLKNCLYGTEHANSVSPQSAAFMCLQRFDKDPQNNGEMTKLKLLQMIIERYEVDPTTQICSDGKTFLHLALSRGLPTISVLSSTLERQTVSFPSTQHLKGAQVSPSATQ